ncbi:MAG: hypothetical protein R2756_15810 [Bacteroidales bacterium]
MTSDGVSEGAPEDLMLTGRLARAFESPMVSFSASDGTFSFVRSRETGIALEGRGKAARMTARALARCGYKTDPEASLRVTLTEGESGTEWTVTDGKSENRYRSLYDLVTSLPEAGQ